MPRPDLDSLRRIKTFPSLVAYLRDDLDWPIESEDFDELTYNYEAEEIGIDVKNAAKIEYIKQLKPLHSKQPWGIFFVKFEPKKLPVVALRRILGQLVIKKRASANRADQQTWKLSDLLFLSNYGENEQRQITFAHFSGNVDSKNLPTLKVLGWDDSDTALHIDHVHTTLRSKLRWPDDENGLDVWRKTWSSAFILRHREVIETSKELAVKLAGLAQQIRKRANSILSIETESGPLQKLMSGFKEALIHDLTEDSFADMYAQTIAYGLLSARITNPKGDNPDELSNQMPITNPFLKELMESFLSVGGRRGKSGKGVGIDFDELGINEVVDLLDNSNMEAVIRDFGDKNPLEDPVIHFYELFLHEYDSKVKMQRGVFYTPRSVVSFIVRSVDKTLRTEFGLEDGLADITTWGEMAKKNKDLKIPEGTTPNDSFVQILDPATGTGTFLVEVINLIHKTMLEKWENEGCSEKKIEQLWNKYVPKHLLPRLHGYELLMAPYAIAHMKIGLKLFETKYHFQSKERARIFITNALEPAQDFSDRFAFAIPALANEATEVNKVKFDRRFTVVIGNPPYSGHSANKGKWLNDILDSYKKEPGGKVKLKEKTAKWLNDDYVKFTRLGEYCISKSGKGILAYITNHAYLDNPTFRGMRWHLLNTFTEFYILDLHGNSKKKETSPDGQPDKNVFDIQQGVAISVAMKRNDNRGEISLATIHHADLWGDREKKYIFLDKNTLKTTKNTALKPGEPHYFFIRKEYGLMEEYENGFSLKTLFPVNGVGMTTARDNFVISEDAHTLIDNASKFRSSNLSNSDLCAELGFSEKKGWNITKSRQMLQAEKNLNTFVENVSYRPFDTRKIFYHDALVWRTVKKVMPHFVAGKNIGLVVARQCATDWRYAFVTSNPAEFNLIGNAGRYGSGCLFPLWLYHDDRFKEKTLNFNQNFYGQIKKHLADVTPESLFDFIYAVLYSTSYRKRYADFLKSDFPRIPYPNNSKIFHKVAECGTILRELHLMESGKLNNLITFYPMDGDHEIQKCEYKDGKVWISETHYFGQVPRAAWDFYIGSYQPAQKWLKDRGPKKGKPGRILTKEDIAHYQKIIVAISETIRIMGEIDEVIENYGGWPEAFVTE
jgi:hypothetical protein